MDVMAGAEPYSYDGNEVGVLVCHGYPSTPQSMRDWAEFLAAQDYTVRLPLLPGHGTTWRDLNATRWQDWYAEVSSAYEDLASRCEKVFAVGQSMGGLLATKIALDHPDVVGLVLVNPMFKHNHPALPILPYIRHLIPYFPGIAGDIKKAGAVELAYDKNPLRAMYSQTRLWKIVGEELPQLTTPVILLRSREDHVVPRLSSEYFFSRINSEDVTEVILEDSYHVATLDNDALFTFEESVDFIERLRY